jgi:crossover junction endodeoxyribonuclease RuvC
MRLLKMPDRPRPADAADALALAICHLWRVPARASARIGTRAGAVIGSGGAG